MQNTDFPIEAKVKNVKSHPLLGLFPGTHFKVLRHQLVVGKPGIHAEARSGEVYGFWPDEIALVNSQPKAEPYDTPTPPPISLDSSVALSFDTGPLQKVIDDAIESAVGSVELIVQPLITRALDEGNYSVVEFLAKYLKEVQENHA